MTGIKRWKHTFEQLHMKPGETLQVFGIRIEEAAKQAYPKDSKECAKQMRQKFLQSIPAAVKEEIVQYEEIKRMMDVGGKLT